MAPTPGAPHARNETPGGRTRRAQIERAAADVLADVGYAATSVAHIAQQAGVSKGVITYHFESKDAILRRVALRLLDESSAHVAASSVAADTPADQLRAQIGAELDFFSSRRVEYRALTEILINHRDPGSRRAFDGISANKAAARVSLLRRGQRLGQFRQFDPDDVVHLISAATNDVLHRWAYDDTVDIAAVSATLLSFIEHAVLSR